MRMYRSNNRNMEIKQKYDNKQKENDKNKKQIKTTIKYMENIREFTHAVYYYGTTITAGNMGR